MLHDTKFRLGRTAISEGDTAYVRISALGKRENGYGSLVAY
jgi:predicted RNA-binding protein with TRAM domain